MKRTWILLLFLTISVSIFGQSREDTLIYIPPVIAGRPDHAAFFQEHFAADVSAANYTLTDSLRDSDFVFRLEVLPNIILYDDGTEELAPFWEPQFVLRLTLIRNEDDAEIVAFSFPFTEMEEMYEYNLYLVYQAMANVPITRLGDMVDESDRWRNKWLYLRASFDYPVVIVHQLLPIGLHHGAAAVNPDDREQMMKLGHNVLAMPGVTLGLELQFLHWMSFEANFVLRFGDPQGETFIPSLEFQLKFPIKPARHFKLSPYVLSNIRANPSQNYHAFPRLGVGGGFQFGAKGGENGAFFIDISFVYTLGDVITYNTDAPFLDPPLIYWNRYAISVGIGYKVGFGDRPPRIPRE